MTPRDIITTTCLVTGLQEQDIVSRSQAKRIAEARAVAAFLAYELTDLSFTELEPVFERDRSSLCRLVSRAHERLHSPSFARSVARVERRLAG